MKHINNVTGSKVGHFGLHKKFKELDKTTSSIFEQTHKKSSQNQKPWQNKKGQTFLEMHHFLNCFLDFYQLPAENRTQKRYIATNRALVLSREKFMLVDDLSTF